MFSFVLDGSSRIGPRPATDRDKAAYPEAWAAYLRGEQVGAEAAPWAWARANR